MGPEERYRWITTPEGIAIPFRLATVGDRLSAFALDLGIILAASLGAFVLAFFLLGWADAEIALAFALLASFFIRNFYFIVYELRRAGATIGKRRLGLRVIARDGGPLTAEEIFARNLTRDLEVFLPLAALFAPEAVIGDAPGWGLALATAWLFVFALMPLFNKDRLRCGDLVAGTLVVRTPTAPLLPDLAVPGRAPEYTFTREQLDLYGIRELQVLEELLRRWDEGLAEENVLVLVAHKIKRKIRWPWQQWEVEPVPFLRAFYQAQRLRLEQKMLLGKRQERKR